MPHGPGHAIEPILTVRKPFQHGVRAAEEQDHDEGRPAAAVSRQLVAKSVHIRPTVRRLSARKRSQPKQVRWNMQQTLAAHRTRCPQEGPGEGAMVPNRRNRQRMLPW